MTTTYSSPPLIDDPYAPFGGDGRRVVDPIRTTTHTKNPHGPIAISAANARRVIDQLLREGGSSHGRVGGTLWVVFAWAERHRRHIAVVESYVGDAFSGFWVKLMDIPIAPDEDNLD